jgi:hypothetical protein
LDFCLVYQELEKNKNKEEQQKLLKIIKEKFFDENLINISGQHHSQFVDSIKNLNESNLDDSISILYKIYKTVRLELYSDPFSRFSKTKECAYITKLNHKICLQPKILKFSNN